MCKPMFINNSGFLFVCERRDNIGKNGRGGGMEGLEGGKMGEASLEDVDNTWCGGCLAGRDSSNLCE